MQVLVCEDDRDIRRGISQVLRDEGYEVLESADGEEAIESYIRNRPDFICLDIMLGELNGYDVCRRIREIEPQAPILFISAKSDEVDRVIALELGGDDYIVKPFGVRELISRIRAITRRCYLGERTKPKTFGFSEWTILVQELRAKKGSLIIDLSLRDTLILELLHNEQGRVVTRDTLFDRCWGLNHVPNSRTLDQHISQLRKKLGQQPHTDYPIETVHGVGYRYPK